MNVMSELWNEVVSRWRHSNLAIPRGASEIEIAMFESKYNVVLPPDVREYFATADGSGDMDQDFYRFWPLTEIKPVQDELAGAYPDRYAYADCFVFADYLIASHLYAVRLMQFPSQPAPVFRVTCGEVPGEQMFESFREFMEHYVKDPYNVM